MLDYKFTCHALNSFCHLNLWVLPCFSLYRHVGNSSQDPEPSESQQWSCLSLPSHRQGVARFYQAKKRHVITTQTEHKCVLDSCRVLESEGFSVTYLPVQKNGLLDLEVSVPNEQKHLREDRVSPKCAFICLCVQLLEASIRPDTSMLSVMTVNNEIGVKQPIEEIGNHGSRYMSLTAISKSHVSETAPLPI